MSDKDLVYFKQGIPAGQQMDKYSENPGMLLSKNADIFSSSNSYKATAFSTTGALPSGVVATDERGRFYLYSTGKVEDTKTGGIGSFNISSRFSYIDAQVKVIYHGAGNSNSRYSDLEMGTPQNIIVKYEGDDPREIVVITDRIMFTRTLVTNQLTLKDPTGGSCTMEVDSNGDILLSNITSKNFYVRFNVSSPGFARTRLRVYVNKDTGTGTVSINQAQYNQPYMNYDAPSDSMVLSNTPHWIDLSNIPSLVDNNWVDLDYHAVYSGDSNSSYNKTYYFAFKITTSDTVNSSNPRGGSVSIGLSTTYDYDLINEYYNVLPLVENRIVKPMGEYYFIYNGGTFPSIWNFTDEWVRRKHSVSGVTLRDEFSLYTFVQFMGWEIPAGMEAVDCVTFNEKVYLICNKDGNGYIYPCEFVGYDFNTGTGGKGTPYIAYGVEFKSAIVLNYLIYLVGENRGVSTLFVYSGTELVHIIEGNKKADGLPDYIDNDEQYKFNGMIADWRGLLVLGTTDNRIFCYGQTYGGRGGSFIHSLSSGQTLNEIKTVGKDLYIKYTENNTVKTIKYQNDVAIKNYNTDFEIVYPVIIGSHMIEKEIYDLYCSYILPSSDCSLEFWLAVNHYYFWTFRIPSKPTIAEGDEYFLSGATGTNVGLTFVEKDSENGEWYTFRLSKNLPIQNSYLTANMKLYKPVSGGSNIEVAYTEFNHFKKIGGITADGYKEGYDRFNNINTKNGFPRTHSLQLMVKGHGTANYTPEVFGVNLVSNQRDRG